MTTYFRYLTYLACLCVLSMLIGCSEEPMVSATDFKNAGDVTLSLKVSIGNSKSLGGTRAEPFEPTDNPYELMNTLRVIIMREDNTVEFNRIIELSNGLGLETLRGLRFDVSTTLGKIVTNEETHVKTRTEKKRIYLVANEYSIPDGNVRNLLDGLKEGYYKKIEQPETPPTTEEGSESEEENETDDPNAAVNNVYVPGDTFLPDGAEKLLIFNDWTKPDETVGDTYALPFVDNEGKPDIEKKFVPMAEFFDISVTSNLTKPNETNVQNEDLFITRNLVKFQFEIDSTPEMGPFRVAGIRFNNLRQKEYLFPNDTKYDPAKYNEDGTVNIEDKVITEYRIPGPANEENLSRPYLFKPENFGYNNAILGRPTTNYSSYYNPELYFCESKNYVGDEDNKSIFSLGIDVEFDTTDALLDEEGKPVYDGDGNPVYEPLQMSFDAKNLDLPDQLPRNTIVKVKMTLTNGELSAVATVYPYTGVWLNPEFGFSAPETDRLTVAPTMDLVLNGADGLLYPNFSSTAGNTIQNLYWVSSDPNVVLLANHITDEHSQLYKEPADAVELSYYHYYNSEEDYEVEPVRIIPKGEGTTYVTAYTQSGLVARCLVTVKE